MKRTFLRYLESLKIKNIKEQFDDKLLRVYTSKFSQESKLKILLEKTKVLSKSLELTYNLIEFLYN